jgi:ankyrin repeat protein
MERGQAKNTCGYPVNVAITHGGSLDVIKLLIDAGPDVLVQKDGNEGSGSLGIALTNNVDSKVIEMLIQANPECVKVADRRGNYPLHVAVSHGMSIELVKTLHSIFPKALQMRNFHSQTPLDIAQRSTRCSEDVMNYLQNTAFSPLEHDVYHLDQHNEADLEDGLDDIMETNF